ncbi:MAG: hypothetical protein Q4B85_09240 [Lachnospiraceae bacterium]|nr:hypothetical protein [Lachnospiraceae bacterium]
MRNFIYRMNKRACGETILKEDSYGPIFAYATNGDLATCPRHMIKMKEKVNPKMLQKATEEALVRFPQFRLGLHRTENGYRYYFLEKPPVVLPFSDVSRYYMGSEDNNGYMFTVGYKDRTIYMEYQHSISDGHGFDMLIRSVLFEYLTLMGHDVKNDGSIRTNDSLFTLDECEDGYKRLDEANPSEEGHYDVKESFHVPLSENETFKGNEQMTEITFSFQEMRNWTKPNGVSPIVYLYTALAFALKDTYYTEADAGTPVVAEIPMDLRQIVPSKTTHFFVSLLDLPFEYDWFSLPFAEACKKVKEVFDQQKAPRHTAWWGQAGSKRVSDGHNTEMNIDEKEEMMRNMARNYVRRDSFILTNIGAFSVPESMQEHIEDYGAILHCGYQPLGILVSSYKGIMKVSLAQREHSSRLANAFTAELEKTGVKVSKKTYIYHPTSYDGKYLMSSASRKSAIM